MSLFNTTLSYETLKELGSVIKNYTNNNPKVVYVGGGVFACTVLALNYGPRLRKRCFAWLSNQAIKMKDEKYEAFKTVIFSQLATHKSAFPEFQKENAIKILEIGVGIGTNFAYYPQGSHLTVVDPNPYFVDYYNENRKKFPNIKSENIIVSTGENMDMVESNSVDAVVVTLVLCSVKDIAKVISQIKRVLVPGGKYYFVDHIQEWDRKKYGSRWLMQHILTYFGIWPGVFDGCCLNRDPLPFIQSVGFSNVEYEKVYAPVPAKMFVVVSPQIRGVATK